MHCALTEMDIETYDLPQDFAKKSDKRWKKWVREHGDVGVELDALPVDVLREKVREEIEQRMNLDALAATREQEEKEREQIRRALKRKQR